MDSQSFQVDLKALSLSLFGETEPGCCVECKKPFKDGVNVHTEAGWRETEMSHMCENCFDDMGEEDDSLVSEFWDLPF